MIAVVGDAGTPPLLRTHLLCDLSTSLVSNSLLECLDLGDELLKLQKGALAVNSHTSAGEMDLWRLRIYPT